MAFGLQLPKSEKSLAQRQGPGAIYLELCGRFNNYTQLPFCKDSSNFTAIFQRPDKKKEWIQTGMLEDASEKIHIRENAQLVNPVENHVVPGSIV